MFRYRAFDSEYSFSDAEVSAALELLAQQDADAHAALRHAVEDDGFVASLPPEEQRVSHVLRTVNTVPSPHPSQPTGV
jgi:hypothetical protein